MPHKYQREIEEILRNLERTEPQSDLGERIRPFTRSRRAMRRPNVSLLPRLEPPVALMLLGILLALVGAGLAYYQMEQSLVSGLFALAGFTLFVVGVALGWWARFRGVSFTTRSLRRPPPTDNVVRIRPVRANPLSRLTTAIRMRQVRRRFRNTNDH
jgi:sulfite exporter TauE/SafE